jgi:hypothetical protein
MKSRLFVAALIFLVSASTFAANTSTKVSKKRTIQSEDTVQSTDNRNSYSASNITKELRTREPGKILNGITASALLTTTSAQYASGGTAGSTLYDSQTLGGKIGYSQVNIHRPGIMARVAVGTKVGGGNEWDDYSYIRPEVSATYGFNNLTYIMGGLNTNKFVRGDDYKAYGMTLGWQGGIGMALTEVSFAELQYVYTKNDYSGAETRGDREQRNLELGLGYNF